MIHALIELLTGFVALMAAAALSQFGVDLNPGQPDREVRRVHDCDDGRSAQTFLTVERRDC